MFQSSHQIKVQISKVLQELRRQRWQYNEVEPHACKTFADVRACDFEDRALDSKSSLLLKRGRTDAELEENAE